MPKKKADTAKDAKKKAREQPKRAAVLKKRDSEGMFDHLPKPETPKAKEKKKVVKKKGANKSKPAYRVMIRRALQHLNKGKANGLSSVYAIYKYLEENYPVSESFHRYARAALKRGVDKGVFNRVRASYRLPIKGKKKRSKSKSKKPAKKKAEKKKGGGKKRKRDDAKKKKPAKKKAEKKKAPAKKKSRAPKKKANDSGEKEREKEVPKKAASKISAAPAVKKHTSPAGYKFRWQYMDGTWKDYEANASDVVEAAYQGYVKNPGMCDVRSVKSGQWQYQVDFLNLKQTNIQHEHHTTRAIRRLPLDE